MSETNDKSSDQDLRRRFGTGEDKQKLDDGSCKPDSLSGADSENEDRLGSDTAGSDHVRKKIIDFLAETFHYFPFNRICCCKPAIFFVYL